MSNINESIPFPMKLSINRPDFFLRLGTCVFSTLLFIQSSAQSNSCATPTTINSVGNGCTNLTNQTIRNATPSSPNVASGGTCTGTPGVDVWYSFVAQTPNPTISLSSIGGNFSGSTGGAKVQVLSGTCPSGFTSMGCNSGTGTTLNLTPSTLNVNQTYFIRVFTNAATATSGTNVNWGFSICITNPVQAYDECAGAVTLNSATTCGTAVEGNLGAASNSSPTINAPNCASTFFDDVWYRFTAQTTNPTITLGGLVGLSNPGIQLLLPTNAGAPCTNNFNSLFCGTTSIAADWLTPGTVYYIRVFSTTNLTGSAAFDICITDPVSPAPFNDNCANAINLPIWNSCNNIGGNMAGATVSTPGLAGGCPSPLAYDVWYKFTPINNSATITLSSLGANFLNARLEILSGSCGSLTSVTCGSSPLSTSSLTAGLVYYIRVYSTSGPAPNGNARFNICATTTNAPVRFGNSYVNITRKTTGGVVQTGDVLEIRMTMNHTSGTYYNLRYLDNVPSNTAMATGAGDRIRIITNEGLFYKNYTLTTGDDPASYIASPTGGQYQIRMNLGFSGTYPGIPANNGDVEFASATGSMASGSRPAGGGGLLFATAYRVVVTGNPGDTITLNAAKFIYKTASGSGPDVTLTATPFKIVISNPLTLCANSIGINSAAEFSGTFGTGTTLNRSSDLAVPIGGYSFIPDVNGYIGVGDGRYALVKNLSPRSGIVNNGRRRNSCNTPAPLAFDDNSNCNKRMFDGFWYIDGDHTGTSNAAGNAPPAAATNASYMLMVNADYVASEIYRQTINDLCPNTYYEFSAWVRNICPTCGLDSTGAQFAGTPTAPTNGYPGVYPNLSFLLNDVDYYNTGEIDTVGWIKRGFVFKTGLTQTSATFSIRNNSQGGGGNDWSLDDIAVATCFPNMTYSPTYNPMVCQGNSIIITDTVRSYFDNYVEYKWQRKVGAGPWTDIPGTTGTATPVLIGGVYTFVSTYTIPPGQTGAGNDGDLYRLVVASTVSNLAGTVCSYTDPTSITLDVLTNCGPVLKVDLLSVAARLINNHGTINWVTSKEDEPVYFLVEKSTDGNNFTQIASIDGYNNLSAETNSYSFTDPAIIDGKVYYRIVMVSLAGSRNYSRIIQLQQGENGFKLGTVLNPFNTELQYEIESSIGGILRTELVDTYGKVVRTSNGQIFAGTTALTIPNTSHLPAGVYVLRVYVNGVPLYRKVVKEIR